MKRSSKSCFIIAEAGINHNGSLAVAKKMVDVAAAAGADAVKFQTFNPESMVSRQAPKAQYQLRNTNCNESQLEMLRQYVLTYEEFKILQAYCPKRHILFLSTPFDLESVKLLLALGLPIFKIPSGEITNYPYLKMIGSLKKKVILSTGMSNMQEIGAALKVLIKAGTKKSNIILLHCNTQYPTPMEDVNLNAMQTIKERFGVNVGYSDHTLGIEVAIAAVALGAKVVEKHFTLDRKMDGPDQKASLNPIELNDMVKAIRNIEKALGSNEKKTTKSERNNMFIARKSIVALKVINKGELFTENNITTKRPGTGISPMQWPLIIEKKASRHYSIDDCIHEKIA
ncbi:MAG: N-acetylneuraminate synthase [Candidatus Margulisiibacteriota bacterium]